MTNKPIISKYSDNDKDNNIAFLLDLVGFQFNFECLHDVDKKFRNPNQYKTFYSSEELFYILEQYYIGEPLNTKMKNHINYEMGVLLLKLLEDLKARYKFY